MKKELSLLAVLALTTSLFVGCGQKQETQPPVEEAPETTATNWQPEVVQPEADHSGHDHSGHGHAH